LYLFEDDTRRKIEIAIEASKGYETESNKIWRIMTTFQKSLWKIDEAVEMGFHKWMKLKFAERKEAFEYMNRNEIYVQNQKVESHC